MASRSNQSHVTLSGKISYLSIQSTPGTVYTRGLQTTARGPNPARKAISSGPRSLFVNDEKIIYTTYGKFFDFVEYNISHNNHIA